MLQRAEAELSRAYRALGDAADWLRSDWHPIGSSLTRRTGRPPARHVRRDRDHQDCHQPREVMTG